MTFGNLVRIQEKGQVTLPIKTRKKLGLKKGDLVAVVETNEGILITPQQIVASSTLDQIGELLKEKNISMEELIKSGREERARLLKKYHQAPPSKNG